MADNKKKKTLYYGDNPVERAWELGATAVDEVKSVASDFGRSFTEQITGVRKAPLRGEINLTEKKLADDTTSLEEASRKHEAQVRYLQRVQKESENKAVATQKGLESQIQKLLEELQGEVARLQQKTAELNKEVSSVTVQTAPAKAGVYHLNFFDWVIGTIRDIRKKVNESQKWLAMWSAKKKKKGYWANAKKKGGQLNLEYMMNEERALASSNG